MKTKICTSIEQSKKLLELGLDADTADMCWQSNLNESEREYLISNGEKEYYNLELNIDNYDIGKYDYPAWSLSALLELIPEEIKYEDTNCYLELEKDWISYEGCRPYDASYRIQPMVFDKEPITDLAYKTIYWLLEQGYIKTEKK